jgi:hypothetical protein
MKSDVDVFVREIEIIILEQRVEITERYTIGDVQLRHFLIIHPGRPGYQLLATVATL